MKKILGAVVFAFFYVAAFAEPIHVVPVDKYAYAKVLKITKQDKQRHAYLLVLEVANNPQTHTTNSPHKEGEQIKANVLMDSTAKHGPVAMGKTFYGYVAQEDGFEVWHITDFGEPAEPTEKTPTKIPEKP